MADADADTRRQYIESLELDWDSKSIDELVADERCPPCFRSELTGPCGQQFVPAYKCFRLCEQQNKDMEICRALMKDYSDCMNLHPERYNEMFEDESDQVDEDESDKVDSVESPNLAKQNQH